jgi:hypothetical protein
VLTPVYMPAVYIESILVEVIPHSTRPFASSTAAAPIFTVGQTQNGVGDALSQFSLDSKNEYFKIQ